MKKGGTELAPVFIGPDLTATPYYAYVTHRPKLNWQTPDGMGIPDYGRIPPQLKQRYCQTRYPKDHGYTDAMTHGDHMRGGRHGDKGLDIGRKR